MNTKLTNLLTSLLLMTSSPLFAKNARSELSRYILMRDRTLIDQDLKKGRYQSIFDLDVSLSSGTKGLISDIKGGTGSTGSQSAKSQSILNVINRNINSERFVNFDLTLGLPLPIMGLYSYQFLPTIFFEAGAGSSMSFNNDVNITDPVAQVYLKNHMKVGLYTEIQEESNKTKSEKNLYQFALYRFSKSDLLYQRTSSEIVSADGLFSLSELKETEITYALDLGYKRVTKKDQYFFEIRELSLLRTSSGVDTKIGNIPFIHAQYSRFYNTDSFKWTPFMGLHFRKRYNIVDGLYLGLHIDYKSHIPFFTTFKLSNQFLTISNKFQAKWFYLSYAIKQPYRNPQDKLWVPTIHTLNLGVPL